jgi:hypothetical protein
VTLLRRSPFSHQRFAQKSVALEVSDTTMLSYAIMLVTKMFLKSQPKFAKTSQTKKEPLESGSFFVHLERCIML